VGLASRDWWPQIWDWPAPEDLWEQRISEWMPSMESVLEVAIKGAATGISEKKRIPVEGE
jgi:hypothetical protein